MTSSYGKFQYEQNRFGAMQVIYIDTLFFINFIVNYLTLMATAKICGIYVKWPRIAVGGMIGGAYSVMTVVSAFAFLAHPLIKIALGLVMVMSVFGGQKKIIRIFLVFFAVAAAFAGIVLAVSFFGDEYLSASGVLVSVALRILLISFAFSYAFVSIVFKRMARNKKGTGGIFEICAEADGKSIRFNALGDTGNSLSDPLSGMSVLVTDIDTVMPILDQSFKRALTKEHLASPVKAFEELEKSMQKKYKFRLIPYNAVGVDNGMLLAFKPDSILVGKSKRNDILIAISPNTISDGGMYSAVIGVN